MNAHCFVYPTLQDEKTHFNDLAGARHRAPAADDEADEVEEAAAAAKREPGNFSSTASMCFFSFDVSLAATIGGAAPPASRA